MYEGMNDFFMDSPKGPNMHMPLQQGLVCNCSVNCLSGVVSRVPTSIQACLFMQCGLYMHAGEAVTLHWYKHDFIVLIVLSHVKLACGLQSTICFRKHQTLTQLRY